MGLVRLLFVEATNDRICIVRMTDPFDHEVAALGGALEILQDLENGQPKKIYLTEEYADMEHSPCPDFSLIRTSDYAQLSLQYSRGCPFNCEFCEITALLGHKVRLKSTRQIIEELDVIYRTGFRGNLFFVDDNFIGNRKRLKQELLPAIDGWNRGHKYPYTFTTEASIAKLFASETAMWV